MGQTGNEAGDGHAAPGTAWDREISLFDMARWAARWWWLLLGGGLVGVLCGLIVHLEADERFTVRLDMTIAESPLGSEVFVRDISAGFLRRQAGTAVAIEFDPKKQRLSLVERGVARDAVAVRQAAMQSAAKALSDFLEDRVAEEYAQMQESYAAMEPSPEAYAGLVAFRRHLSAMEDGLIEPATVIAESVRAQSLPLGMLSALGALAGIGLAAAVGLAAGAWRRISAPSAG